MRTERTIDTKRDPIARLSISIFPINRKIHAYREIKIAIARV